MRWVRLRLCLFLAFSLAILALWPTGAGASSLAQTDATFLSDAGGPTIIKSGYTSELPACPSGQIRNASSECEAEPPPPSPPGATSENGYGVPRSSCEDHSVTLTGSVTVEASCFHVASDGELTATGRIRVNGLDIVISKSGEFTLDPKTRRLSVSGDVDVYAGSLHIYHGDFSWDLAKQIALAVPKDLEIKGLPVGGEITLSLTPGGVRALANATIGRAPYSVSGTIALSLRLESGLELSSFKLELASELPIDSLVVHRADLAYRNTSAGEEWKGAVEVELPDKGPDVKGCLTILGGAISDVALKLSHINEPLGEIVYLQSLGLDVQLAPKPSATGMIGLSAGPEIEGHTAAELDGSLKAEIGDPFILEAKGTLSLVDDKLADARMTATIPGGVSFEGTLAESLLMFHVEGKVSGEVTAKSFEAEGEVKMRAPIVSASGYGLVDDSGLAGCALAKIGLGPLGVSVTIGVAHRWDGENSLFEDSCGFGRLSSALIRAGSADLPGGADMVPVPPGTRQVNLVVHGSHGPPEVQLTEGKASALALPESEGEFGGTAYLAIANPTKDETDIAIAKPPSGTIELTAAPRQPALLGVSSSLPLPASQVSVKLLRLGPRRYRLIWSARAIQGQTLTFEDMNRRGRMQLPSTASPQGARDFSALDDGGSRAQSLRIVVKQNGLVREIIDGPGFTPAPVRLMAPRVSVSLRGAAALVRWTGVAGARSYRVWIATSNGRHLFFALDGLSRTVPLKGARSVRASVRGVGAGMELGRAGEGIARRRASRPSRGR